MADTGTGTDPTTDRCPDCGHPLDSECPCSCCLAALILAGYRPWHDAVANEYERIAGLLGWRE